MYRIYLFPFPMSEPNSAERIRGVLILHEEAEAPWPEHQSRPSCPFGGIP